MDTNGVFAVAVNPALKDGQQIIVTDTAGHASAPVKVTHLSGPAGP
jgi:hypothetical protein